MTEQEALERARNDKRFLIESAFSIVGINRKLIPFKFNALQDQYWKARTQRDLILKSRKMGFSTLLLAEGLAHCMVDPNAQAIMVAHRDEDAIILFERVQEMFRTSLVKIHVGKKGERHLQFPAMKSSFRVITAGSKDAGRSRDITFLHLSERASYQDEDFLAAVEEACVPTARVVIETTARGGGTPFEKFWIRTVRGDTASKPFFFPWFADPRYALKDEPVLGALDEDEQRLVEAFKLTPRQLGWRREKLRQMTNPGLFQQEYPATPEESFLASGAMVFDWLAIQKLANNVRPTKWTGRLRNFGGRIELAPSVSGELSIWEMPRESSRYIIGADVAEGMKGHAYSVADVIDTQSWEQVAQWRGHIAPDMFSDALADLGAYYNWALLIPEVNNHGLTTCTRLRDNGYPRLYDRDDVRRADGGLGWLTTERSKVQMVNLLARSIRDLELRVNSVITLDELKSFVHYESGRMAAQAGSHSDCVMSLSIAHQVLNDTREAVSSQRQKFREGFGLPKGGSRMTPTGYGVRRA